MVAIHSDSGALDRPALFCRGLTPEESVRLREVLAVVRPHYEGRRVLGSTGQSIAAFADSMLTILASLDTDLETRIAAVLLEWALPSDHALQHPLQSGHRGVGDLAPSVSSLSLIEDQFGQEIAKLVASTRQLMRLHGFSFAPPLEVLRGKHLTQQAEKQAEHQVEILRKMLLAMASDVRVVLLRLAARVVGLRYFSEEKIESDVSRQYARETLELYAPLANRLGIWQLKWELEDLSFRFIDPVTYKRIARQLEERRIERESFIQKAIEQLRTALMSSGIPAEVSGRPKHIYSIWKKMCCKGLAFDEVQDVRAFRVIVNDVRDCYAVLGIVHHLWTPVRGAFDDYISRPKPNGYQSLHTIVMTFEERTLEVQIRTHDMHHFAEYGVAAHWRYKESGGSSFSSQKYDEKIAWLRQLLAWKSELIDVTQEGLEDSHRRWLEKLKSAAIEDHIYVLTPQARVIELPWGATPIDFAYHLHTDLGHRCRGARVDGTMVPLNTPLKNGQTVNIITAKNTLTPAGPSRDWLTAGYAVSRRTRSKIRLWFNAIEQQEARLLEGGGEVGRKQEERLSADLANIADIPDIARQSRPTSVERGAKSGVLVVGEEGFLTQLAKCCKPAPPDPIVGFTTRGRGISIHRDHCRNFMEMQRHCPERVIQTTWGTPNISTVYPVDIFIFAHDRQGLLRDISDVFLHEKINVIGVSTQSAKHMARMAFTAEIPRAEYLNRALTVIRQIEGVVEARRY